MGSRRATFYYDLSSPYAYLAALRVDDVLPVDTVWQPIAFGALIREIGKVPWSMRDDTRAQGQAEIAGRARARGLPDVRWPRGWPAESYSVVPLRAALHAGDEGRERELSFELYRLAFVEGVALDDLEVVIGAAERSGLDGERVRAAVQAPEIKDRLRVATDDARRRGVTGVPTVAVGDELFWGDDRLEDAARAAAA
ncbi:MAG TPA: DsbA family protein [Solirubrobacteraceae bacterium]|nr:DsbA family protein [Solirubrobacteraceae bacterium]